MWGGALKKGSGGKLEGKCGVRALGARKGTLPPFEALEAPFQAPFKALKPLKPPSSASKPLKPLQRLGKPLKPPSKASTLRPFVPPPGGRESVASVGGF